MVFRRLPHIPNLSDPNPLILNEEEQQEMAKLDSGAIIAQKKRIDYLRKIAKEKGITAAKLEDLKSQNGIPFKEEKSRGRDWSHDYRKAVAMNSQNKHLSVPETAYLCKSIYLEKDPDSCGWVKGKPIEKEYDDISFLSGSAGTRFFCKICCKKIGEHQMVQSFSG